MKFSLVCENINIGDSLSVILLIYKEFAKIILQYEIFSLVDWDSTSLESINELRGYIIVYISYAYPHV